ncbi:MAG: DUF6174 domain-containing protein [Planctomycetota bacterium]
MKAKRRLLTFQRLDSRLAMDAAMTVQPGFPSPNDVNRDGVVSPRDALIVINAIENFGQSVRLPSFVATGKFVDVNGDGQLSPADALQVANRLAYEQQARQELNAARAKWNESGPGDYNLVLESSHTLAPPNPTVSLNTVAVRGGTVTSPKPTELSRLDVNGLFERIQEAIESQYHVIDVEYDPENGAPVSIQFDVRSFGDNDRFGYRIIELSLANDDREEVIRQLAEARETWQELGPADYDLSYQSGGQLLLPETFIQVRGGEFQSEGAGNGRLPPDRTNTQYLSVDGLFDVVQRAIDNDYDSIDVVFDEEFGYPVYVSIESDTRSTAGPLFIGQVAFRHPGSLLVFD